MPLAALPRIALRWTPDGRRKTGRPKETWRRTVQREGERDEGEQQDIGSPKTTSTRRQKPVAEALCVSPGTRTEED